MESVHLTDAAEVVTRHGTLYVHHIFGLGDGGIAAYYWIPPAAPVAVRVQSSCVFSESLGAIDCDCSDQLSAALQIISDRGGLVVYAYEEGRGAGLSAKVAAIRSQKELQLDTAEAFGHLGLEPDLRSYELAACAIREVLGDTPIVLLTNDPRKANCLRALGVRIAAVEGLVVIQNELVRDYLSSKAAALGSDIGQA